jgi:hypothetical protein
MYRLCHDRSAETLRHCEILLHTLVSVVICEHNKGSALGKTINYSYIDLWLPQKGYKCIIFNTGLYPTSKHNFILCMYLLCTFALNY